MEGSKWSVLYSTFEDSCFVSPVAKGKRESSIQVDTLSLPLRNCVQTVFRLMFLVAYRRRLDKTAVIDVCAGLSRFSQRLFLTEQLCSGARHFAGSRQYSEHKPVSAINWLTFLLRMRKRVKGSDGLSSSDISWYTSTPTEHCVRDLKPLNNELLPCSDREKKQGHPATFIVLKMCIHVTSRCRDTVPIG